MNNDEEMSKKDEQLLKKMNNFNKKNELLMNFVGFLHNFASSGAFCSLSVPSRRSDAALVEKTHPKSVKPKGNKNELVGKL